jgi:hypothetical protein
MPRRLLVLALGAVAGIVVAAARRSRLGGEASRNGGRERTAKLRREVEEARERLREDIARARERRR